ncbi:acetylornithine deacetylase [Mesorhizobium sp. CGMCC 1.15528]|uniref:Acetylornithine deacetylase n=1 Tax=Mesorhizobium zhangyense TaxID=1776730 RepID=A0A7C9RBL5_9HYPH|nr:acetylornithine deacetylase [Mesorhizobium zhangyense]NGN44836.1 acetylornithine deacetylase [Mesorhizobium zhangyense]
MSSPRSFTPKEMLERLVAFPTVSSDSNLELIEFVKAYLAEHGVSSTVIFNEDGSKANLFATIGPMAPGGVVLSGHTDVVPALEAGWTNSPWSLTERNGRLYGRGSCDMKGFNALALAAVPNMLAASLKAPIHIALSYDEEVGCKGAPSMVERMIEKVATPRAVFVGEPTRMRVVNGHKGIVAFNTHVRGHAVHSSRIDTGVSAVMIAARLVTWLDDTLADNSRHPAPGAFEPPYTTLHCGVFNGGVAGNIVAESCSFVTDIRAIPQETGQGFRDRFEQYARTEIEPAMKAIAPNSGIEIEDLSSVPGLAPEPDGNAEALALALTGANDTAVVAYATEGGIFQNAGWSTIVVGPGDIAQAHQVDEYIEVEQLAAGERFIRRLIADLAR